MLFLQRCGSAWDPPRGGIVGYRAHGALNIFQWRSADEWLVLCRAGLVGMLRASPCRSQSTFTAAQTGEAVVASGDVQADHRRGPG